LAICLERGANGPADATATPFSFVSLKSRNSYTFFVRTCLHVAYPGKEAIKQMLLSVVVGMCNIICNA